MTFYGIDKLENTENHRAPSWREDKGLELDGDELVGPLFCSPQCFRGAAPPSGRRDSGSESQIFSLLCDSDELPNT